MVASASNVVTSNVKGRWGVFDLRHSDLGDATATMPNSSEQQLLEQIRGGNRTALGLLLKAQERRLYNVCLRMVSNRDDAAEVCQDAMLKIVQSIDRYRGEAALSTWMIRIAMNTSISHLRKRRLRQTVSLDGSNNGRSGGAAAPGGGEDAPALRLALADDREPGPVSRVQTDEMLDRLHRAIAGIEDDFRAVVVLRDIDEMEYQQIADTLELPIGTVKSRLFRARLALREQMEKAPAADAGSRERDAGVASGDES